MTELRILAAGYGKFDHYETDDSNPANKVAKAFEGEFLKGDPEKYIPHVKGYHIVVPVVWDKAWPKIKGAVEELQPDAVICMGAAGATKFERMARNEARNDIADADGKYFQGPYIVDDHESLPYSDSINYNGREKTSSHYDKTCKPLAMYANGTPTPYFFPTRLPFDYLEDKMNNTSNSNVLKVPNAFDQLSFDAGGYLCNLAFYMPALFFHGKVGFTGFLHVEPGKDSMYEETGKFIFNEFAHWLQRNFIRVPHDR
ncbi:MAG: hypothetical protein SWX82_04115 [Cyanobacteriota bacterium]|nr:hypothetical protein [Cyanobacteriota bacterium]